MDIYGTVLVSALVSVLVAYVTARAANYSKDVIEERQKWRERIRVLAVGAAHLIRTEKTSSVEYEDIVSEFRLRLNPDDPDDEGILETLEQAGIEKKYNDAAILLAKVCRLLKFDWERAKAEARLFSFFWPSERMIRKLKSKDDQRTITSAQKQKMNQGPGRKD